MKYQRRPELFCLELILIGFLDGPMQYQMGIFRTGIDAANLIKDHQTLVRTTPMPMGVLG